MARRLSNDLPPWYTVYQQIRRWLNAGVFEALAHDVRMRVREIADRAQQPRTAISQYEIRDTIGMLLLSPTYPRGPFGRFI